MNPDHFVYDMSPGELVKNLDIGVRYHVDCSTEYPVSHGLRVKVLHEMELRRLQRRSGEYWGWGLRNRPS